MSKTTLYLVRHGQSIGNSLNRMLGHTDLDLTELGYKQAEMTANALRDVNFAAIYSSDLLRAKNTAQASATLHNLDVITDEGLREIHLGKWEGAYKSQLDKEDLDLILNGWHKQYGEFRCPGGEAVYDATMRVYVALEEIARKHEGQTVMATLHAGVIRGFWGVISGIPKEKWATETVFPSNSSYSIIEYDGEKFTPVSYSNDEHMGEFVTRIKM